MTARVSQDTEHFLLNPFGGQITTNYFETLICLTLPLNNTHHVFLFSRDDVQRDHSLEPGQGEHAGRGGRGGHHQLRGQPGAIHDPRYLVFA